MNDIFFLSFPSKKEFSVIYIETYVSFYPLLINDWPFRETCHNSLERTQQEETIQNWNRCVDLCIIFSVSCQTFTFLYEDSKKRQV